MSERQIVYKTRSTKVEPIEEGWFAINGGGRPGINVRMLCDDDAVGTVLRISTEHTSMDVRITPAGRKIMDITQEADR